VFRNSLDNFSGALERRSRYPRTRSTAGWSRRRTPDADAAQCLRGSVDPRVARCLFATPRIDPRVGELAREIVKGEYSHAVEARLVEKYLRTRYGYTLELP
jgi:hypothetical protein